MWPLLTSLAFGQAIQPGDFIPYAPVLLDTNDVSWTTGGVGSPAVVHDEYRFWIFNFDLVLMVYETQTGPPTASCPAGEWSIGVAYSQDGGQSFTDYGQPLVEPTPGTYYSCVAAHPTVVDFADGNLVMFFKAEQGVDACDGGAAPSWGCDRYTGLGRVVAQRASIFDPYTFNISPPDPTPVLTGVLGGNADLGFPKAVLDDGEYHLTMQQRPDIYHVHGATSSSLTLDPTPIISAGFAPYANDEAYNAAVACKQDGTIQALVGGRDRAGGSLVDQGIDGFVTADWATWTQENGPFYQMSQGAPDQRHFDLLRYSVNEFALFWDEPLGPGGTNRIRAAHTSVANISENDRVCP